MVTSSKSLSSWKTKAPAESEPRAQPLPQLTRDWASGRLREGAQNQRGRPTPGKRGRGPLPAAAAGGAGRGGPGLCSAVFRAAWRLDGALREPREAGRESARAQALKLDGPGANPGLPPTVCVLACETESHLLHL